MSKLSTISLAASLLLLTACGPVESQTAESLGTDHGMFDTHVVSKSMLRAALKLGDATDSLQLAPQQQELMDAVSTLEKVVVFNKDGLGKDVESVLAQEIRQDVEAEGSELLLSTSIASGVIEVYVVESEGIATRLQAIIRSPYNSDGTRSWPEFSFGQEVEQAQTMEMENPLGDSAELLEPKPGLTFLELNGQIDIALVSRLLMSQTSIFQ